MSEEKYKEIENWTEADLLALPKEETDYFEYKSSLANQDGLKEKIKAASSGFLNSGGGVFIIGINDKTGLIDGGITETINGRSRRDWVDSIIFGVQPLPPIPYIVKTISPSSSSSLIESGKVVLLIGFPSSHLAPHMAADGRYYVRTGASTRIANHFLVEAMRTYRGYVYPMLRATLQKSESGDLELVVLALNSNPALNVSVSLDPWPETYQEHKKALSGGSRYPLMVPIITLQSHFTMYISRVRNVKFWTTNPVLTLVYEDITGKEFRHVQEINFSRNLDIPTFPDRRLKP